MKISVSMGGGGGGGGGRKEVILNKLMHHCYFYFFVTNFHLMNLNNPDSKGCSASL